jgi:hypothetical protein
VFFIVTNKSACQSISEHLNMRLVATILFCTHNLSVGFVGTDLDIGRVDWNMEDWGLHSVVDMDKCRVAVAVGWQGT